MKGEQKAQIIQLLTMAIASKADHLLQYRGKM